jgi:predicted RND superfamily exporter protein
MASSPLEPLVGYGICISIGIAWAWLLSSITLPAIINLKKWNPTSKAFISHSIFENFVEYLGRVIVLYPRYIFSIGIVLFLLGSTGIYKVIVDVNLASFFKPGTEIRNSMDFMDQEMTGTMDLRIRLEAEMKEPSVLRKVDSLQYFIEKNKSISITSSISDVVKKMHRTVMNDSAKYDNIPVEREKVNNLFTMYAMSGNVEDFSSMVNYNNSIGLVTSLSRVMSTEEVFLFVNNISDYIKNHFNDTIKVNITGMIVVIRDMVTLIIRSSAISIVFSLFLVIMIASIFFKKIYWGVLAALPLSGAVILNFGLMGHFNVTLNHITAILSSIIIGVGIDFAIHFISQYQKLSKSVDRENLSEETIRDVGYPIVLDAASNMGFGALIFSSFVPVQYIGGLMIFAMISTALGTLIVLASLMEILKLYLIK